jgi:F0F1-type ATP synthase membrane subunit a
VRIVALGTRISVNMITGHTLVKVIGGFIWDAYSSGTSLLILALPMVLLTAFLSLEILIAYLQAYIYTFISCLTIKDFS